MVTEVLNDKPSIENNDLEPTSSDYGPEVAQTNYVYGTKSANAGIRTRVIALGRPSDNHYTTFA